MSMRSSSTGLGALVGLGEGMRLALGRGGVYGGNRGWRCMPRSVTSAGVVRASMSMNSHPFGGTSSSSIVGPCDTTRVGDSGGVNGKAPGMGN